MTRLDALRGLLAHSSETDDHGFPVYVSLEVRTGGRSLVNIASHQQSVAAAIMVLEDAISILQRQDPS